MNKAEVIIDMSKLDTSSLVRVMLEATNIEDVQHARIDLQVKADCRSDEESTGCSNVVIEMSGIVLPEKKVRDPWPLLERGDPTKTETKKLTKTVAPKPLTATVTLTTTDNGTALKHAVLPNAGEPALPTATRDSHDVPRPASTFTTAQRTVR